MGFQSEMTGISVKTALEKLRSALGITNDKPDSTFELATKTDIENQEKTIYRKDTIENNSTTYPSSLAVYNALKTKIDKENPSGTGKFSLNECTAGGENSMAIGYDTVALGDYSFAEGYREDPERLGARGKGSHSEGKDTNAIGEYSHAEGDKTNANGIDAHAEGYATTASGLNSHAEGSNTAASGISAHAEGANTSAKGNNSHAEGTGTIASSDCQHVQGKYNVKNDNYIDIIGWGTDNSHRANVSALDSNGNLKLAGEVYIGCDNDSSNGTKITDLINEKLDINKITERNGILKVDIEGNLVDAESGIDYMASLNPAGTGSLSLNRKANTTIGINSIAIGSNNEAGGDSSFAEGYYTTASGNGSHAEGFQTIASGDYQHVQGQFNVENPEGDYVDIVGWGENKNNAKNISALTTSGDLRLAGNVYIGCNDDSTGGTKLVSGGGEGGTSNYNDLDNKPQINNITLTGNKTPTALGLEETANKVTTISSTSTNTQYPSAKAVYGFVMSLNGNEVSY